MTHRFLLLIALVMPSLVLAWDNNAIDRAWRTENVDELERLTQRDDFDGLYSHYRIALLAQEQGNKKLAKQSLAVIFEALEDNYQTADQAALYYNALGLSIALKPWTAALTVKKASKAQEFSETHAPNHAPSLVAKAIGLINRPAFAGGDKALALTYLDQALALYQQSEAWAFEDAWLWKIKTLQALNKPLAAKQERENLLKTFPDFLAAQRLAL